MSDRSETPTKIFTRLPYDPAYEDADYLPLIADGDDLLYPQLLTVFDIGAGQECILEADRPESPT